MLSGYKYLFLLIVTNFRITYPFLYFQFTSSVYLFIKFRIFIIQIVHLKEKFQLTFLDN